MILVSELISKPILNLYTGTISGTVKNICVDKNYKKIQNLEIFDNEDEDYLLDIHKVYTIGKDMVVIKNDEALKLNTNQSQFSNLINLEVITATGESLGKLKDIEFNEKYEIQKYITQTKEFKSENILNIKENIILNNNSKKLRYNDLKPKINLQKNINVNIVKIMPKIENEKNEQSTNDNLEIKEIDKKRAFKINLEPTPQKIIGNENFLLGRKVTKTIYGINNEIIIKKDSYISQKNLDIAKKHSKLTELTIYSKSKI